MSIFKMALPRRTFLRGMGVTIALPLLDAMIPAFSVLARTPARPVKRLGFIYTPNGATMSAWTPAGEGPALTELSPTLSALAPFRDQVIVPTGLSQRMAESMGDGNGEHSRGQTVWLSGVHPKRTEGADVQSGVSVDQIAAQTISKDTPLLSIEMALEQNYLVGNCDNGYSCVYWNTISWRTPTTPLPMEVNPRVVTLLLGRAQPNRPYPFIGVPEAHHSISHHQNDPVKLAKAAKINTYHIQLLAYFAERLNSIADGDGTLLDHSMILQGSGLS